MDGRRARAEAGRQGRRGGPPRDGGRRAGRESLREALPGLPMGWVWVCEERKVF